MLMRKCTALCMALLLLVASGVGVTAHAEEDSAWVELMEFATVNDSGSNVVKSASTVTTISIRTPQSMRCCKIDMLVTFTSGTAPTAVAVMYNGIAYPLKIAQINATTARIYGDIPDTLYSNVLVRFTRSSSTVSYYEVLSCRITGVTAQEFVADASVLIDGTTYSTATQIEVAGNDISETSYSQIRIDVYDWMKYDTVTIWGSALTMGLTSVRATVDTVGLPFEMSYTQTIATGETTDYTYHYTYTENYTGGGGYGDGYGDLNTAIEYNGKILYCITIDLSGVDRTLTTSSLRVFLTGVYTGTYGYTFNCQYVNGSIVVPDTTNASWWTRFKNFMTDLFGGDTAESDDYQDEAGQQRDELDGLNTQLEDVNKPDVDGIQMDIGGYVDGGDSQAFAGALASLTGNSLLISMMCITLTIALVGYVLYGKR